MSDIIIPSIDNLEKIKAAFQKGGADQLHLLSDFDKTLNYASRNGQQSPSVIAQLRENKALTPDYPDRAFALYNTYHQFENDSQLTFAERSNKMKEWWQAHHELLIECGLTKASMDEVVAKKTIKFRSGTLELIDRLHEKEIPLIIMSSGPGYMIEKYLKQEDRLYDNVSVIANIYDFDDSGKMIGAKEPIIHVLNKYETAVADYPIFHKIKNRKNVILLGDHLDDVGMITGFDYENLLKIGFLNNKTDELLSAFKQRFDIIITDDGDVDFVNSLIKEITG